MGDNMLAQVADKFFDVKETSRGLTVNWQKLQSMRYRASMLQSSPQFQLLAGDCSNVGF